MSKVDFVVITAMAAVLSSAGCAGGGVATIALNDEVSFPGFAAYATRLEGNPFLYATCAAEPHLQSTYPNEVYL